MTISTKTATGKPYRIVLLEDHALVRRGIKKIIMEDQKLKVVGKVCDGLELLDFLKDNVIPPDVIIMDIFMPNMREIEATKEVRGKHP